MVSCSLVVLAGVVAVALANIDELPAPEGVKLVFIGFRHANRNPGQFLKGDPNEGEWGQEGESMLTKIGKQQAYAYGKQLRKRYDGLIEPNWRPEETKVLSSSADRVQGTVQTTLAGLFPPQDFADWSDELEWQPVSYSIDNELLRMYAVKCPTSDNAFDLIYDGETPEGKELLDENKAVIDFVAEQTGLDPKLGDMADVADNLEGMHIRGLEFPEWVTTNPFGRSIYEEVEKLAEAPQILCAKYDTCRRLMAGYWLDHIYNLLNESTSSDEPIDTKMVIYGTHNEIMSSLLWLLGHERDHGVYFHGSGVLEFRSEPAPAVRLLYSEPTPEDPTQRASQVVKMNFCDEEEWCPIDKFMAAIKDRRFTDWEEECGLPDCACAAEPSKRRK